MSSRIYRSYSMKDDKLIILVGVARDHYIKYKASFNSFNDVIFPPDYEDVVLGKKLLEAKEILSDAFVVKRQAKETADVQEAIKKLLRPMKILAFIVNTHFARNSVVLDEFMLNRLHTKAQSVDTLIGFTKDALNTVEKYQDELVESGLKPELVTIIKEACASLDKERRQQIKIIKTRPGLTQERVEKMNDIWQELVKLSRAANVIFEDHPQVKVLFDLPRVTRYCSVELPEVV